MNIACTVVFESCNEVSCYFFDTKKLTNALTAQIFNAKNVVDFGYSNSQLDSDDFEEFTEDVEGVAEIKLPATIDKFVEVFVD